jgi:mono/diheme cytochrome c family protein
MHLPISNFKIGKYLFRVSLWLFIALLATFISVAVPARAQASKSAKPAENVSRGKYLVEGVAMCGQCHTPRDSSGNPDTAHKLEGGPLWLLPAHPMSDWPIQVPRIGGSISASDAELITLLTTGIWRNGAQLRSPMPQFRMSPPDASAVVAYLRSLNLSAPTQ